MLQHLPCHRADVVKIHARIARDGGPALGPEDEVLRRTRPRAKPDVLADGVGRLLTLRSTGVGQQHRVADDVLRYRHRPDKPLNLQHLRTGKHRRQLRRVHPGRLAHHADLLVDRRVVHLNRQHEPVRRRLRQLVRALLLNRVARGENKKRARQRVGLPADTDLALLHRLQHRRLCLRRRAIDLVRQQQIRKHRPLQKLELAAAALRILLHDVRACDVRRHQVRRELDALERQIQRLRQRPDQQRLGQPRHTGEQRVFAAK